MKKTTLRSIVDTILFVSVLGTVVIGVLSGFIPPNGHAYSENAEYPLDLYRHNWRDIHLCLGVAFAVALILHLTLGMGQDQGDRPPALSERTEGPR